MEIVKEYRRLRNVGWKASEAYRAAKVRNAWEQAGDRVSLEVVPDDCPDLSYLDQECFEDIRAQEYARANSDGVWGIVAKVDGEPVDSVWGFTGEDWKDSGYDIDLMSTALRIVEETPSHWLAL